MMSGDKIEEILVSICCLTYNHERYIRQALDSFLMQKTNFIFEIVIHEDASTDNTQEIIKEYVEKYPKIFNVLLQTENQRSKYKSGMNPRFNYPRAKGKYIALCEGDDYWTDPYKLQKQVDIMETEENFNVCYHRVEVEVNKKLSSDENDITEKRYNKILNKSALDITTLLEYGNFIHTCSVLFRKNALKFPYEMFKSPVGDYFLYIVLTKDGGCIKKINESMGVYRRGVGIYSSLSKKTMSNKILTYQTCILSLLEKEEHRKIMLNKILKRQKTLFKEADSNNLPFKTLINLLLSKGKNKLQWK